MQHAYTEYHDSRYNYILLLLLFGGDLEAGILSQPTGKFPEGARQPRLIVPATGRKQCTPIITSVADRNKTNFHSYTTIRKKLPFCNDMKTLFMLPNFCRNVYKTMFSLRDIMLRFSHGHIMLRRYNYFSIASGLKNLNDVHIKYSFVDINISYMFLQ
jgi:hypothetical protein